jgi:hypothetical protein
MKNVSRIFYLCFFMTKTLTNALKKSRFEFDFKLTEILYYEGNSLLLEHKGESGATLCPTGGKSGVQRSWPICQVCSCAQCAVQMKLVYCGSLLCLAYVESCEAETCPPPHRAFIPYGQATTDLIYLQPSRKMNLDSAHPGIPEQPTLGSAATG